VNADEVGHAALRGAIGAMTMTGVRVFYTHVGVIDQTPPDAIFKQRKVRGLISRVPRKRRRAVVELCHWGFGAGG